MKYLVRHQLVFFLFLFSFEYLNAEEKAKLVVDIRHRPPEMKVEDKVFSGPIVDIVKEVGQKMGLKLYLHEMQFPLSLRRIKANKADLLPRTFCSKERAQVIDYVGPIGFQKKKIKFLVRQEDFSKLKKYEDLHKLSVGMKQSTIYFERFDKDAKIKKISSKDDVNMVRMLAAKRFVTMIVVDELAAKEAIKKNGLDGLVFAEYYHQKKIWHYFAIGKTNPKKSRAAKAPPGFGEKW